MLLLPCPNRYALAVLVVGHLAASALSAEPPPKAKPANRLAKETSPYLLGHAHNPVDWYPWGEEALAKAKQEGKLILLSIGYSSCHWCHVMERESFEDEEIAAALNKDYVCIKIDREERPDIDHQFMTALRIFQQLSGGRGGGGWPLTMILTPEGKPLFGGTYFPARDGDRGQATGFLTLIKRVQELWSEKADKIRQDATTIADFTRRELEAARLGPLVKLDEALVRNAQTALAEEFDPKFGGFGYSESNPQRPKFPEPSNLVFLLERVRRAKDAKAQEMLAFTLEHMAAGGIYDHIGGGFHRYSVDRMWQIPHFEKMLYDNAQVASVYAAAGALLSRDDFQQIARETCDFMLRELRDAGGGFYAALDAETEGEEGKFYRWTREELQAALSEAEYTLAAEIYGFDDAPNFEGQWYVPQLARPLAQSAKARKLTFAQLREQLQPIRDKLLAARNKRTRPLTDTKVLTAENGLAIRGLADVGRVLQAKEYVAAAEHAAEFVLQHLRQHEGDRQGRLLRTYAGGKAKLDAYLNDYAYLIDGLLALHQATKEERWLRAAEELQARQLGLFGDEKGGGFFFTASDHEALLARIKDPVDGALPAGNSISVSNLLTLAKLANRPEYVERGERAIQSTAALLESSPTAVVRMAANIPQLFELRPAPKP
jgi:uncharacterized protein YyaL (SSP411 family)